MFCAHRLQVYIASPLLNLSYLFVSYRILGVMVPAGFLKSNVFHSLPPPVLSEDTDVVL